ncbi:MAG: C-terminal binding protein [Lawsonibacter sp.]
MNKYLVCVSDTRHASYEVEQKILAQVDAQMKLCDCVTQEDIVRECADADAILLDMAPMTAQAVAGLKRCKVINRYGVGYDNVDVDACTAKGIQVTNVPDYCAEDVSDHALALIMTCLRQTALRDRLVRQGQWNIQRTSFRLSGKVLGVLGFGRIARTLVKKTSGFGFSKVLVYDPYVSAEVCASLGAQKAELEEVLRGCDILSLHMPVTPQTTRMINRETLALMKPTAILVNTGRGPLVDDEALAQALLEKKLLYAGLDTHWVEPLPAYSPYRALDNVVLTDHTAYSTVEAVEELKTKSARNIVAVLRGEKPGYPINQV